MSVLKFRYIFYFLMSLTLTACKNDVPDGILSDSDMEDVLYDYHTAQKLGRNPSAAELTGDKSAAYNENYYVRAALKKHQLTEADFERSLKWYTRHSDRLFDIYKKLDERMSAELGAPVTSSSTPNAREAQSDTVNIWQGAPSVLFSSMGNNRMTFAQKPDTLLKEGDLLKLNFNTHWIYREGSKTGVAQLTLVYPNDSVQYVTCNFGATASQSLSIRVGEKPVQAIRGFIYQQVGWSEKPKILSVTNIQLLRVRDGQKASAPQTEIKEEPKQAPEAMPLQGNKIDPASVRKLRDSLRRADSIKEKQPHFK